VAAKRCGRDLLATSAAGAVRPGLRVLVVDDEPPIRDIVAEALREVGWEVDTASNGAEALERLDQARPDVIVLDLMMPVMDAGAFTRLLRRNPTAAGVPIVILTAAYAPDDEAARLGAAVCLTKPFTLEDLIGAVESAAARAVLSG
jgi:CheY-like chemotaxis protein